MTIPQLLIIDDEEAITWSLRKAFEKQGFAVRVAPSAEKGLSFAKQLIPHVILLDVRLPGMDGLTALPEFRQITRQAPVIIMTAFGNLSTAVKAVEGGAFDYLVKPFDLDQAIDAVQRAMQHRELSKGIPPSSDADPSEELIGRSLAMQTVFKRIALVAPHEASVLITGESGTGKELVARAIHRNSLRRNKPFLPVHIAALNPNLVESELFGHVKGAFTGANQSKTGLLSVADGGTVFLDELADIPLPVQAKLLRVLEHQEVIPVGGHLPQQISVRILAATHQDLLKQVNAGQFRHDLYFRLNVFEVHLPSLQDRLEDIPILAQHFLKQLGYSHSLSEETIRYLQARRWVGNVRELRNAIEHAAILARNSLLLPEHFPAATSLFGTETAKEKLHKWIREWVQTQVEQFGTREPENLYDRFLEQVEPLLLEEVLRHTNQNRLVSARWLGLARATLRRLISKYHPDDKLTDEDSLADM